MSAAPQPAHALEWDVSKRLQVQSEVMQLPLASLQAWARRMDWLTRTLDRPEQRPPPERWTAEAVDVWHRNHANDNEATPPVVGDWRDDWFIWLMMAGRGAGKTRAGAEDVWWYGFENPGCRIAVVAPTSNDCRKTCFEGESGLLAVIPPHLVANWNRGEQVLTLTNGTMYQGYSAEEPDRLRGPQHHRAWCDELAAWRYLDDTLDNLLMGLRLGEMPRIVATTTPRPLKRLKEIVADPTTWVDSVSTYANLKNLPRIFVEKILKRFEGTRKGRQELHAEILTDNPGALWQREQLDADRVVGRIGRGTILVESPDGTTRIVQLQRVVVAVDPASGGLGEDAKDAGDGDETGITVEGLGDDGHGYVLADCTVQGTPGEWGRAAVIAYDTWAADCIVYEANQGGEMVRHTLVSAAAAMRVAKERTTDFVPTKAVWASRGKVTRAEPVSALYEQHRIHHVGCFPQLEDQMCEFTTGFDRKKMGYSPDRMDSLVWGFYDLMLDDSAGLNVQDFYRQEHGTHQAALEARQAAQGRVGAAEGELVLLVPPQGVGTAFGILGNRYDVDNATGLMSVHQTDVAALLGADFELWQGEQERAA